MVACNLLGQHGGCCGIPSIGSEFVGAKVLPVEPVQLRHAVLLTIPAGQLESSWASPVDLTMPSPTVAHFSTSKSGRAPREAARIMLGVSVGRGNRWIYDGAAVTDTTTEQHRPSRKSDLGMLDTLFAVSSHQAAAVSKHWLVSGDVLTKSMMVEYLNAIRPATLLNPATRFCSIRERPRSGAHTER
jgi:hypothetical protein